MNTNANSDLIGLSLKSLNEKQPDGALAYAAAYTHMGLVVIPNDGKKPLLKQWPSTRLPEEELPHYFSNGQNIGLVNGEASGGAGHPRHGCTRGQNDF